ncbi:MAG TPA: 16S rRNA (guanine(527)-N(7))-methyltransferase RsmG [Ignavibacteria bacterium]|nr:16S rRNA (guanine(527)-N(7))-methyltransferase RsmG [Ignavibacteria bacterium]
MQMQLLNNFLRSELGLNPELTEGQFIRYEKLLLEWNKKINLVSRKTESIEEHILNSVFFLRKFNFDKVKKVADIGTGGGFPGVPLKILFPEIEITFIDSIKKKTAALEDIVKNMNFKNAKVICGRAEEIAGDINFRKKYNIVISKAVAPLDKLFLWGKDLLNSNGEMLCLKGGILDDELKTLIELKRTEEFKFNAEVVNFDFNIVYKIEDKKIVIIKLK